jgi:hypothetical protein
MDAAQPASRLTCPSCGTLQDSPGSTVCELCGAELLSPVPPPRAGSPRSPAPAFPPERLPRAFVRAIVGLLALIVRAVMLAVKTAVVLAAVWAAVLALISVPAVGAKLPAATALPAITADLVRDVADRGLWWTRLRLRALGVLPQPPPAPPLEASTPEAAPPPPHPAGAPPLAPRPARLTITVRSTPSGATVLLNQRRVGRTPVTLTVAPGRHTITVSRPGYRSITRTITVRSRPATIRVRLTTP